MATELPIDPVTDSPVFRASLASLEAKTQIIQKKCKSALQAALAVSELLEKLEGAESQLFDTLDELKQQIVKVDSRGKGGHEQSPAEAGVVKDLRAWKMSERMAERQQLETLVTSRVKALQMDLKVKGLSGGGALNTFEDQARTHYQAIGKYLLPSTSSKHDTDRHEARQSAANADYALNMYTMHSQLLWSAPPYSPPCLELGICLNLWLRGVLSEGSAAAPVRSPARPGAIVQSPDPMTPDALAAIDPTPGAPFPGTRRRLRTLSQKASMPTLLTTSPSTANLVIQPLKSVTTIKEQLRQELEYMSYQKQILENAWNEREKQRTQLSTVSADVHQQATQIDNEHTNSKRQSFQSSRPDSLAKSQVVAEASSPVQSKRMRKVGGMGKRLRGMIQSASFSANLSLKTMGEPAHESSQPFSAPRKSMQLDTSSTTSSSQAMARPQPEKRHSFAASSSSRPTSYSSPFLPSPILPANENGFPSDAELFSPSAAQASQAEADASGTDVSKQVYRDLQSRTGNQVLKDELHRESAGRKREGMLWTSGVWEDVATSSNKGGDRKERAKWEHCWVVLAGCKLYEYRDALSRKPELGHGTIDLQFANARQGRDTDRRFTFEIVTPHFGKRMYQTTSYEDMKSWIYAICNAIESNINGTSTLRVAIPNHAHVNNYADDYDQPSPLQSSRIGLGFPSSAKSPLIDSADAVPIDPSWTKAIERRTSFKDAFRSRANLALQSSRSSDDRNKLPGHKRGLSKGSREIQHAHTQSLEIAKASAMRRSRSSLSVPGAGIGFLHPGSRQSSRSSKSSKRSSLVSISDECVLAPAPAVDPSLRTVDPVPFPVMQRSGSFYQLELDDDMRNAVLHADPILTLPETSYHMSPTTYKDTTRELAPSETMTQERFHDALASIPTPSSPSDMALLRKIANQPGNQTCSDCGHPIKGETSQRWATISIHNNPQVLFLCIRCAGVHRSFGTHISKVRSPDLDKWSDEAILTARAWGNSRGNQIWERHKPPGAKPRDDSLAALHEYIENKYVKGIWLSDEDRQFYLNEQAGIAL